MRERPDRAIIRLEWINPVIEHPENDTFFDRSFRL
jgi:hypothetical protein